MEGSASFMFGAANNTPAPVPPMARIEQAGAICLRALPNADLEVLLIASSRTGQWGLPKGHIEPGETSFQTALREANEEAGIEGQIIEAPCGSFLYRKTARPGEYRVTLHLLMVTGLCDHYPERTSRKARWVPLCDASREIANPDLVRILGQIAQSGMEKAPTA